MATRLYYVYEHWRLDRDECFYVGKGHGGRAYSLKNRNKHHQAIVAKLNKIGSAFEVRMVITGISEDDAFRIEMERIEFWEKSGVDLANLTKGGEGVSGLKMSDEAKEKMRLSKLGKKQSPETIAKRIAPLIGRKQPRDAVEKAAAKRRGRKLSDEHKQKLVKAHTGKIVSEKARQSLSLANKGKPWSQARRDAHNRLIAMKKESLNGNV